MNESQCYHDTSKVTDELVEKILLPGLEPGAVDIFLDFICYSDGPLPEELLPKVKVRHHLCVSSNVFFSSCSSLVTQINFSEATHMSRVKIEKLLTSKYAKSGPLRSQSWCNFLGWKRPGLIRLALYPK